MSDKPVAAGKSSIDLIDIDRAFELFDLKPDSTFLDLVCGVGRYSLEVERRFQGQIKIHAVDLWKEGIAQLENTIAERNITAITPLLADIRADIDLEENRFDAALLATILHDLPHEEQVDVIKQAVRLLKPGAFLNIVEFKKIDFGPGPPIKIRLDADDLDRLLRPFGFEKIDEMDSGEFSYIVKYKLEN